MNDIGQRLVNEANFLWEDRAYHFPKLLANPLQFLTWGDVEYCANNPAFYEFEMIDHENNKVNIDRHVRSWVYDKTVQDARQLVSHINHGHTFIIMNYGFHSRETQELLKTFESIFAVDCAIHVYGGKEGSKSFNIHDDYPSNFIIQVEGETEWKIYKNRISSMLQTGFLQDQIREENLEVDLHVTLQPGDALYIPSRAYHCAFPRGERLSMSIPCWTRMPNSTQTSDRNYYPIYHA
jgi:ribosomal protein L16 Arg81 hydroxylase|tara:strand:- start:6201 stop:6911 length:711 start_codon:yes stop_codon:yes gene_type:complete